jgi:hypothetical protein
MAVARLLIVLGLTLAAAGAAMVAWSLPMERFIAGEEPLLDLIDPRANSAVPGGNDAWRRAVDAQRTDKDRLFDFGGSLITTAIVLLLTAWLKASNGGRMQTPSSRLAIVALFLISYVGMFYITGLSVHWDVVRHINPPWVETLQPAYGLLAIGLVLFFLPFATVFLWPLTRHVELPVDLVARTGNVSMGGAVAAIFYSGLCFVFVLGAALAFGTSNFPVILPYAGLAYLALCAGAIANAPATKKAGANAPAFAT